MIAELTQFHKRSTKGRSQRRPVNGFTLIELLMTLAIVGILAGLLLPALGKAQAAGRRTSCLNNFRQWCFAMHVYTDDHGGNLPRESFGLGTRLNLWSHAGDSVSSDVWYNSLPPYLNAKGAGSYYLGWENRQRFYDRSSLFHCPAARFPAAPHREPWPLFSMAMNSQLVKLGLPVNLNDLCRGAQTVMFLDNRLAPEAPVDVAQADFSLGQPSASAYRFVTRHAGLGNLVFWDGHAVSFRGSDVVELRPGPTRGGIIEPEERIVWNLCP